jgi:hypothetical protein
LIVVFENSGTDDAESVAKLTFVRVIKRIDSVFPTWLRWRKATLLGLGNLREQRLYSVRSLLATWFIELPPELGCFHLIHTNELVVRHNARSFRQL